METKDQQVKHVVEGVALGVLAQGVSAVTSAKMTFEFAFNRAWSEWSRAQEFPSVAGNDPGNQFWIGVSRSKRRRGARAAWNCNRWSEPYVALQDWSVDECLDLHADERATVADWVELGMLFVEYFEPQEIRRMTPSGAAG